MKTKEKKFLATICFVLLFVVIGKALHYMIVDDTRSYTRLMMHQLYYPERNIDVLFVGSSHVYRTFIPEITDESFGAYTFNAGTSSQYMDGSLAIIKEALRNNDIQEIYLELYFGVAEGGQYKERTQLTSTYAISDYMLPSLNRTQYLMRASSKEYYSNGFFIVKRNWERILDPASVSYF